MAYEYEKENISKVNHFNIVIGSTNVSKPSEELKEVYRKAKAFDEIVIETTGCLMYSASGLEEEEAGRITFGIIQKYEDELEDMEDIQND